MVTEKINNNAKTIAVRNKQKLLVRINGFRTTSCSLPGYFDAQPNETFLLIDDVCGSADDNALLVINKAGSVGYISSDVEFLVVDETEIEPFLESLIKCSFVNEYVHKENRKDLKSSFVKKQEKDIIHKLFLILESLEHQDTNFDVDSALKDLAHLANGKVFSSEFQTVGPRLSRDLATRYLKDAFSKIGNSILKLLKVMGRYNPCIFEFLIESDFPTVVMMDVIYKRYDQEQLIISLEILKSIFEINAQDLPPQITDIIRGGFLLWLIEEMDIPHPSEEFWRTTSCLIITIYSISSLASEVTSKILSTPRAYLPRLFVLLAKIHGIRSSYWQLLVDLLTLEGSDFCFSKNCTKDLVELVWYKRDVMEQNNDAYMKILETLCHLPVSETFSFKRKILECLKAAYQVFPELQNDIWILFKKINEGKHEKIVSERRLLALHECSTAYIPTKLKAVLGKLEHVLEYLSEFKDDPCAMSYLEVLPTLRQCYTQVKSLDLAANYKGKTPHYVYNLNSIHNGLETIDSLFLKFCAYDVQRLSVLILSEICSFFPSIITHALQLKMIPTLLKEMTYFSNKNSEFCEILIIILTRLLCNSEQFLPTSISECLQEEFISFLIEKAEQRGQKFKTCENTVSLLLAINLYKTKNVIKALSKADCTQTIKIVKHFLKRGFDPLCAYNSTFNPFSPVKIYSDIMDNAQTAIIIKDDYLQSILEYSITYLDSYFAESQAPSRTLEIVPSSSEDLNHVPEALRLHLQAIFRNSLKHCNLLMPEVAVIQKAEHLFSQQLVPIAPAQQILHHMQKIFDRKCKSCKFLPKSESYSNFSLPDTNNSYFIRKSISTHYI